MTTDRDRSLHGLLTGLLWIILLAAVLPTLPVVTVFTPIILLFGKDNPGTSAFEYWFSAATPLMFAGVAIFLAVMSLRLWRTERGKIPAFILAIALCFCTCTVAWKLLPH